MVRRRTAARSTAGGPLAVSSGRACAACVPSLMGFLAIGAPADSLLVLIANGEES